MARWRSREPVIVPGWVWDDVGDPAVMAWLDDLWARDRAHWDQAVIEVISTPTYGNGSRWSPGG